MSIRDLIEQHVKIEGRSNGWYHCKCQLCNDYKVRASFKFDEPIKYNCFNCGDTDKRYYYEGSSHMTKEFKELLIAFGISESDIDTELSKYYFENKNNEQTKSNKEIKKSAVIQEINLPNGSYRLESATSDDLWAEVAKVYLESRKLNTIRFDWYLSNDPKYEGRLIIPFYKNGKIIYWQARSLDPNSTRRYLSPDVPIEPILFNYDELHKFSDSPLFVTEGAIDALFVNGVGMLGSKLYRSRLEAFQKTKRRLIFVIDKKDKDNNGYNLGLAALENNWEITAVDGDAKDINDSVKKYGKLFTLKSLLDNTKSGFDAKLFLEIACNNNKK